MKKMRPQKQLLQFAMLALLSVFSVLVMADESSAALQCYDCHGSRAGLDALPLDTPAGSPPAYRNITTGAVKGNHQTHLSGLNITAANQSLCARCHNNSGYTSSHRSGTITLNKSINTITGPATGYNGAGMSDGGTFVFKNQTTVPTLGSCSSVNCHFEAVTPTWGSDPATSINCNSCHASVQASASHPKHTAQYGGTLSCVKCHAARITFQHATSAGNVGRKIDLTKMTGTYSGAADKYLPSQTPVYGTCSTNYCHSSGQSLNGASATPIYAASPPLWGNSGSGSCGSCHAANLINSGSHGKHVASDQNCGNCHNGAGNNGSTMVSATHVDGFINVSGALNVKYSQGRSSLPGNNYGTCNNASCHAPFTNAAPNTVPTWGVIAPDCSYCHATTPTTGAHTAHLSAPLSATCGTCHTSSGAATHIDGFVNVIQMAAPVAKHVSGNANYTATCTATCHNAFGTTAAPTPNWGLAGNCSSCHTTPPATGLHTKHLTATAGACAQCHAGFTATTAGAGHANGNVDVTGQGYPAVVAKHTAGSGYQTCATATCHDAYGATGIPTPNWVVVTTSCASCHAASPTTGSHSKHVAHTNTLCASCHTAPGAVGHVDSNVSVNVGGYPAVVAKHVAGSGYSTCTATCHNGPASNPFTAPALTWGSATTTCGSCHGNPPAGANHAGVAVNTCNGCHSNVVPATSNFVDLQLHMNGIVEGGKCDSCHGYPPVQTKVGLVNYSGAKLQNYSGGGGVHAVAGHLNPFTRAGDKFGTVGSAAPGCVTCHPSTSHNLNGGIFLTANVQVVVDPQFKFDKNRPIVYNAKQSGPGKTSGTCANVSCHFQKTLIWSAQPYTQGH